jgi:DNA polymerase I-like protein with 3'-5' exonuclease and polymerase domains
MWDDEKFAGFDLETSGILPEYALQPHRVWTKEAWITAYGLAGKREGKGKVIGGLMPDVRILRQRLESAVAQKTTLCGWNIMFDAAWCCAYDLSDLVMQVNWLDGMLLWRHLEVEPEYEIVTKSKKRSFNLETAMQKYYPDQAYYKEFIDFHNADPAVRAQLLIRCKKDVVFSLALVKHFYNQLAESPARLRAALLESRSIPLVASAWVEGILVDQGALKSLDNQLVATADRCLKELAPFGVTAKIVKSPKQMAKLLFKDWDLPVIKQTDSGGDSTDKETLHELAFLDPRAKTIRDYREALGNRTKFSTGILKSVEYNGDGRTRPQHSIFSTYTGRMTVYSKQGKNKDERPTGFALHQEKRDKEFRNVLMAPPGYTLCEFDAAGQEFRWMAIASKDETMLSLCMPGEDPHSFMGARIDSSDYRALVTAVHAEDKSAKAKRQLGKVSNLSLQFRTSAGKLRSVARVQYNLNMSLTEANVIRQTYLQTYARVPKYWDSQINECRALKYVETFAGRRVQLLGDFNGDFGWSLGSTCINYRIQGTGADQKYLALAVLRPYIVKHGIRFAWELHDGLFFYVPDEKVVQCVPEMKRILDTLPYTRAWGFTPPIPLPWDAKTGKAWGDLKEYQHG